MTHLALFLLLGHQAQHQVLCKLWAAAAAWVQSAVLRMPQGAGLQGLQVWTATALACNRACGCRLLLLLLLLLLLWLLLLLHVRGRRRRRVRHGGGADGLHRYAAEQGQRGRHAATQSPSQGGVRRAGPPPGWDFVEEGGAREEVMWSAQQTEAWEACHKEGRGREGGAEWTSATQAASCATNVLCLRFEPQSLHPPHLSVLRQVARPPSRTSGVSDRSSSVARAPCHRAAAQGAGMASSASPQPTADAGQLADPFDQPNFDVQHYVNTMFPSGENLRVADQGREAPCVASAPAGGLACKPCPLLRPACGCAEASLVELDPLVVTLRQKVCCSESGQCGGGQLPEGGAGVFAALPLGHLSPEALHARHSLPCTTGCLLQVQRVDAEILEAVRVQSSSGARAREELAGARAAIEDLFARIHEIQRKAEQSELMVQEICRDIKKLDYAKKHLTATITALRRLSMLVNAVGARAVGGEGWLPSCRV